MNDCFFRVEYRVLLGLSMALGVFRVNESEYVAVDPLPYPALSRDHQSYVVSNRSYL